MGKKLSVLFISFLLLLFTLYLVYLIENWSLHFLMISFGSPLIHKYYAPQKVYLSLKYLISNEHFTIIQFLFGFAIPIVFSLLVILIYLVIFYRVILNKFINSDPKHGGDESRNAKWATWDIIRKKTNLVNNENSGCVIGSFETPLRQSIISIFGESTIKPIDDFLDKKFGMRLGLHILIEKSFNEHILGYAPSRSGKGVGLVIPTLLRWRDSMIILDPKGELYDTTSGYAKSLGFNVINLDLGTPYHRYNIFDELNPQDEKLFDQVDEIVNILLEAAKADGDNAVFTRNAVTLLRGIILFKIKSEGGLTITELAYAVAGYNPKTGESFDMTGLLEKMKDYPDSTIRAVGARFYKQAQVKDNKTFQSFLVEIEKNLAIFMSPSLAKITSTSDFKMQDLVNINKSPTILYLRIPSVDALTGRINTVSKLILHNLFVNVIYKTGLREKVKGKWNKRAVLGMMDEFPSIGKFEIMENLLADAGGFGLKLFLIAQSDKQINRIYGEQNSIFDGCTHKVIFAPNEIKTAEVISKHLGTVDEYEKSVSTSVSKTGKSSQNSTSTSTSYQRVQRELLTSAEVFRMSAKKSIILTQTENGKIAIFGNKFKYFENQEFLNKVNISKEVNRNTNIQMQEEYNTEEDENTLKLKLEEEIQTQIDADISSQSEDWLKEMEKWAS